MIEEYLKICHSKLRLKESVIQEGKIILSKILSLNVKLDDNIPKEIWIAVALFISVYNHHQSSNTSDNEACDRIRLSQILVCTGVNFKHFFENIHRVLHGDFADMSLIDSINVMKEDFTISKLLFSKYEYLWEKLGSRNRLIFESGWFLFIVARRICKEDFTGLADLYILMVACLYIVLSESKVTSVEAEVAATLSSLGSPKCDDEGDVYSRNGDDLRRNLWPKARNPKKERLENLCKDPKIDPDGVLSTGSRVIRILEDLIVEVVLIPGGTFVYGEDVSSSHKISTSNVFEPRVLSRNVSRLSVHYDTAYLRDIWVFDDRLFVEADVSSTIGTPSKPSISRHHASVGADRNLFPASGTPWPYTEQAWQMHGKPPPPILKSPAKMYRRIPRSPILQTPVTAAVETQEWMRQVLVESPTEPNQTLLRFFKECTPDPTQMIHDLVTDLVSKINVVRRKGWSHVESNNANESSDSSKDTNRSDVPQSALQGGIRKTRAYGVGLYYKVLEALLISERERLKVINLGTLLNNAVFHRALFACSMEVVLKAHSLVTLAFPKILELMDLKAFDFGKVIESFVKHAPSLPSVLKRHMQQLEEKILESLAWEENSSLYQLFLHEPMDGKISSGLQVFFRKLLGLAANRIFAICSELSLEQTQMNQVWTTVKYAVTEHCELLRNRHLNQIILCSIYGVCKVNRLPNHTFKKIMDCYKNLFFLESMFTVTRDIPLDSNGEKGDIIKFYNVLFIPVIKSFLLHFQHEESQQAAINQLSCNTSNILVENFETTDNHVVAEAAALAAKTASANYTAKLTSSPSKPLNPKSPRKTTSLLPTSPIVEPLPRPIHHTSPKRVLSSNLYLSPRRQVSGGIKSTRLTPRTRALYAFGESPSKDLALINRAVNNKRATPDMDIEKCQEVDSTEEVVVKRHCTNASDLSD